jgi:excisionase family DNA binding protein
MANHIQISAMMTPREAARMLHIHVNTLRRWSNQDMIRVYRIGSRGDRRYMREDVTRFLYQLSKNNGDEKKAQLS